MEEGIIGGIGKAHSSGKAYEAITEFMGQKVGFGREIKAAYMHRDMLEEALKLRRSVRSRLGCVEEIIAPLLPSLGVHPGPGTVGISLYPVDYKR